MSSAQTPDFPSPSKGKGSQYEPTGQAGGKAPAGPSRGKYPKDSGGPPEKPVVGRGPSGDPKQITATTFSESHSAPAKSPRFVASRDI